MKEKLDEDEWNEKGALEPKKDEKGWKINRLLAFRIVRRCVHNATALVALRVRHRISFCRARGIGAASNITPRRCHRAVAAQQLWRVSGVRDIIWNLDGVGGSAAA